MVVAVEDLAGFDRWSETGCAQLLEHVFDLRVEVTEWEGRLTIGGGRVRFGRNDGSSRGCIRRSDGHSRVRVWDRRDGGAMLVRGVFQLSIGRFSRHHAAIRSSTQ